MVKGTHGNCKVGGKYFCSEKCLVAIHPKASKVPTGVKELKKRKLKHDLELLMPKIHTCETKEQDRKKRDPKEALVIHTQQVQNGRDESLMPLIEVLNDDVAMFQECREELEEAEKVVEARLNEVNNDAAQTLFNTYLTTHPERQNDLWEKWHWKRIRELEAQEAEANGPGCLGCEAGGQYHDKHGNCSFCFTIVMGHPYLYPGGAPGCPYDYTYACLQ